MSLDLDLIDASGEEVYETNITHNLIDMATEAKLYDYIWRPEELGITQARDLIQPVQEGLLKLVMNPSHYRNFDAPNGWGRYDNFVIFVADYLEALRRWPDTRVLVDR
jgi:hypothetical protein